MSPPAGPLTISVIICTKDRAESLAACIDSVCNQSRPPAEVLVVDDGQLDVPTTEAVALNCRRAGIRFEYLRKRTAPGLTASRNLGVSRSVGDIVQFLDDDVSLEPGFCAAVMQMYEADSAAAVLAAGGSLSEPRSANPGAAAFAWLYSLAGWWSLKPRIRQRLPLPAPLRDRRWYRPDPDVIGATMSFRRQVFTRYAFDEALPDYALGEDRDMLYRVWREGWVIRCTAARAVHHCDPAARPPGREFGLMSVRHYLRIMGRIGRTGPGDRLVIGYTLAVLAAGMLVCAALRPQRYGRQLLGLAQGLVEAVAVRPV